MPNPLDVRAKQIIDKLVDSSADLDQAAVERACGEDQKLAERVRELLRAIGSKDEFLSDATISVGAPLEHPGTVIGRYRLLEQLGQGGFGSVWAAEQREPVNRRVAIKIIKVGMDSAQVIARFEAERQALAMMDHPNIAKVFDAGSTETGRPYFVMELVKGVHILEYCDTQRLDTQARMGLFIKVCHAIQHAHQKGIIHRDIKPSNVLITMHDGEPVPKVIDFGIAKATNAELTEKTIYTQHRQMIGTPAYMSPEQAEMTGLDIDTRSDIYSLGVLLYELLTGATPFAHEELMSNGFAEMMRMIREVEPPRPSTRLSSLGDTATKTAQQRGAGIAKLSTILKGDLDWIVMKCLEKDRRRRYESASGLAMDLRRHLAGESVLAAPPSTGYRLRKFVRRHRGVVIAASAVGTALMLGMIGTGVALNRALRAESMVRGQLVETEKARQAEKTRTEELRQVSDFQGKMLAQVDPTTAGVKLTEEVNRRYAAAIRKANVPDAEARAEAFRAEWVRVNATDVARSLIDETILKPAAKEVNAQFKDQPVVEAFLQQVLAIGYRDQGLYEQALPLQEQALETRRRVLGQEHLDTLVSINNIGSLLRSQGKLSEAEPYTREALEKGRRLLGEESRYTLESIGNMGSLLKFQGKLAEAEPYQREAMEKARRVLGEEHPDTLIAINNLGALLSVQGKLAEAEPYYREVMEKSRRVLGEESRPTIMYINNLGSLLQDQGKLSEAETYGREALDKSRRVLGEEHPTTLLCINNMGSLLSMQGKLAESEQYYRESLEKRRRVMGDEHPETLESMINLGSILDKRGKQTEAESCYRAALPACRRLLGEEHRATLTCIGNLGHVLVSQGRYADAEPYMREALDKNRRVFGENHPSTLLAMNSLGTLLRFRGKLSEAEPYLREALEKRRRLRGEEHPDTLRSMQNLGDLLRAQGKLAEAEPYFREALEKRRRVLGEDHPETIASINGMGNLLRDQGKHAEAEPYVRESLEKCRRVLGAEHPNTLKSLMNLGVLLQAQGHDADAEAVFAEGVSACGRAFKVPHPTTAMLLYHDADTLRSMGRLDEALSQMQRALDMYRDHPDWSPEETKHAYLVLEAVMAAQGKPDEALAAQRSVLAIERTMLPEGSAALGTALATMGKALVHRSTLETAREAEPLLRECLDIRGKVVPEDWLVSNSRSLLGGAILLIAELDSALTPEARSDRLRAAEPLIVDGYSGLKNNPDESKAAQARADQREALERLVRLYDLLEKSQPGKGYDGQAATWRAKLVLEQATEKSK
jgi:serine/threonine protein kinase/tetratricopeptide (TPR) repeat protein